MCHDRLPEFTNSHIKITKTVHIRLRYNKGLCHQQWQLKDKVTQFQENLQKSFWSYL
jgi:hypothetical protein